MNVGVSIPSIVGAPVDVAALAKRAEELGFYSIWVPEHPILPVTVSSAFPQGGPIPESYSHMMDPFIALATASAVTSRIRLGTGVCLVPEHNPLVLAKVVATLDHYSGGRFLFGIGAGWNKEETEIMGGDFEHRWTQTKEAVLAMKALWTEDEAEYHGEYYDFPAVRSYPKPAQKPHPPVILGGMARNVLRRVAEYGDGWLPNRVTPEQVQAGRATLDELAATKGRDPKSIQITVFGRAPDKAEIKSFADAGAEGAVVRVPGESTEEALANLDQYARQVLD